MLRRIGVALGLLAVAACVAAVVLTTSRGRGYFGPVFAPDGASVYVLVRDVSASVVGLGYDTLTPWMDDGCYCGGNKDAYRAHLQAGEEPCGRSRAAHKASALAAARRTEGRQP